MLGIRGAGEGASCYSGPASGATSWIRATSVDAPFRARENIRNAVTRSRMLPSVRPLRDHRPPACMGVRGAGPDQGGVLEVRGCSLVVPLPSRRLLRYVLLPLALRLGGRGGLTPPRPEPCTCRP